MKRTLFALMTVGVLAAPVHAQTTTPLTTPPPYAREVSLAGPRFGMTVLNDRTLDQLRSHDIHVSSSISQFGWQFERQFFTRDSGVSVLNEWVALVGGLDQGVAIPSLSWVVGVRTKEGAEFGVGPNVSPGGVGLVVSAGVTFRAGPVNVPMNVAVVPSRYGTRVSVLTGFVMRR